MTFSHRRRQGGFSLVELAAVLLVIAILTLIAIRGFATFTAKAQISEAMNLLGSAKPAAIEYREATATWAGTDALASISANGVSGKYIESLHAEAGGALVATFRNTAPVVTALQGKAIAMGFAARGSNAADAREGWLSFCGRASNDPSGPDGPFVFGTTDPATLTTVANDLLPSVCKG
ncbi:MAG: pilin [Steroidobacteraceae bacterium]